MSRVWGRDRGGGARPTLPPAPPPARQRRVGRGERALGAPLPRRLWLAQDGGPVLLGRQRDHPGTTGAGRATGRERARRAGGHSLPARCCLQIAGVQHILDSIMVALQANPNRRFSYAEMVGWVGGRVAGVDGRRSTPPPLAPHPRTQSFFTRWWRQQDEEMRDAVKELVKRGQVCVRWCQGEARRLTVCADMLHPRPAHQRMPCFGAIPRHPPLQLDFINGGYVQHDEAAAHYVAMIDQTTRGHRCVLARCRRARAAAHACWPGRPSCPPQVSAQNL